MHIHLGYLAGLPEIRTKTVKLQKRDFPPPLNNNKKALLLFWRVSWILKCHCSGSLEKTDHLKFTNMLVNTIMFFFLIDTVHFQGTIQSRITSNFKSLRKAMLFLNSFNTRYTVCQIKSEEIHYMYISLSVAKYSTSKINISSDHKLTSSLCYLVPLGSLLFTFSCIYNASQR